MFSSFKSADSSELESIRGAYTGIDQSVLNSTIEGLVTGNSTTNTKSGDNTITETFDGTNGIYNVLQNSGSNVLMQNATVVNVTINNQATQSNSSQ